MAVTRRAVPSVTTHVDSDPAVRTGGPVTADDEFLTVCDVAERLRVPTQTVRSWIVRGELRAIRISRTVRIRRADFEDMLERARIGPAICIRPGDAGSSPNRAFRARPEPAARN